MNHTVWFKVKSPIMAKHRVVQEGDWIAWDERFLITPVIHADCDSGKGVPCFEIGGFDFADLDQPVNFYACNVMSEVQE